MRPSYLAFCFAVAVSAPSLVLAQAQPFPSKAITIIVPAQPGGPADLGLRAITEKATEDLKVPFIIQNRSSGGGGAVAAVTVKQAAPDGYTLFQGTASTHAANKSLIRDLPYDPVADFRPVSLLYTFYTILTVPGKSPARSVADLVALARKKPGGLFFLSSGYGTAAHLAGEMLKTATGAPMVHVPLKGMPQALNELVGERADFFFTSHIAAGPFLRDGRLRVLAITSPRRAKDLPEVPTMAEAGYPGFLMDTWFGVLAPAKTPDAVVRRLNQAFTRALAKPDLMAALEAQGLTPVGSSPEDYGAVIVRDVARFGKVIRESGARAD